VCGADDGGGKDLLAREQRDSDFAVSDLGFGKGERDDHDDEDLSGGNGGVLKQGEHSEHVVGDECGTASSDCDGVRFCRCEL
jgi:hypothetical protein